MTHREQDIKQDIINHPAVASSSDWVKGGHNRTYINLAGASSSYRGDRTTRIYWDNARNELVISSGKGITSDPFICALTSLLDDFGDIAKER